MKLHLPLVLTAALLTGCSTGLAQSVSDSSIRVNCGSGASLQQAIDHAAPGSTIVITGTCAGPVTISSDRLTIEGSGTAVIEGHGKDAVTLQGAQKIALANLEITGGNNGIVENGGASATITNVSVHDNAQIGISLQSNSSATVSKGGSRRNGLNGIDLEASSSLIIAGTYSVESNAVFGLNINTSSSLTFTGANLTVTGNTLGIQVGTSSGAFITDSTTTITVANNLTTGLTIVSGAHMVAFGGTIISHENGIHGISVDSKAGFDLDAAAFVESSGNTQDGVHLEETSVLTMFNTPAFSGAPGVTTIKTFDNGGNGVSILTGSNLTVIHQASISSTSNKGAGIAADNGSGLTLIQSTVTGNAKDILLTFGSRGDITTTTFGTLSCDATGLLRGTTGIVCPH